MCTTVIGKSQPIESIGSIIRVLLILCSRTVQLSKDSTVGRDTIISLYNAASRRIVELGITPAPTGQPDYAERSGLISETSAYYVTDLTTRMDRPFNVI